MHSVLANNIANKCAANYRSGSSPESDTKNQKEYSLKRKKNETQTFIRMISELAPRIAAKNDGEKVMDCLHSLADISNDYLDAKNDGNSELQSEIEKVLKQTFDFLLKYLG